jgi:nitrite reductase/ring-hydroxylating ferredoxin subunit
MATTVVIPAATLAAYPTGKAVCQTVGGRPVIIYKASDGAVKVAPNSCAHMGNMGKGSDMLAKFSESKDIEDAGKLVCGFHQATLDPSTMIYSHAPKNLASMGNKVEAGTKHPEFVVKMSANGDANVDIPAAGGGCAVA